MAARCAMKSAVHHYPLLTQYYAPPRLSGQARSELVHVVDEMVQNTEDQKDPSSVEVDENRWSMQAFALSSVISYGVGGLVSGATFGFLQGGAKGLLRGGIANSTNIWCLFDKLY